MEMNEFKRFPKSRARWGYSKVDLVVALAAAALFAICMVWSRKGERSHIARCIKNLGALGAAISSYASDNNDCIPVAGANCSTIKTSWDAELFPYL
ncbi:MAG TPA: hypothetical protein VFC07_00460, partial [Verrucomicrobiae bacterium]|nr:hypothetical protein [Verrucomicrobiae bacterium]